MYVNPTGFAGVRKRVEDLYKAHEQELQDYDTITPHLLDVVLC
jgi:GTP pyrophosphokinase